MFSDLRKEDNNESWQQFTNVYGPLIEQSVRRAGVSGQDIDDVVQTVLLQLAKVLPSFTYQRNRGFFRTWLRRVSVRKAIDLHRRQSGQPGHLAAPELLPERSSSEYLEELEFQWSLVQAALTALKSEFRPRTWQCFIQHVQKRQSAAETSLALGISENAVYVNSSRVLSRMREFCTFHGEDLQHDKNLVSHSGSTCFPKQGAPSTISVEPH